MNRRDTLTGVAGGTDSALIAASVELLALGAEGYALTNDKESQAFWKLHLARYHDLENEIIDTPATTQGGLLAKAQAANSIVCLDDNKMPLSEDAMLWSICQDIIKGAGGRDVSPDAELIHACDVFATAHAAWWQKVNETGHLLPVDYALSLSDAEHKAKEAAGIALGGIRTHGLAEHALRASTALRAVSGYEASAETLEEALQQMPEGLLLAIVRDLAAEDRQAAP